MAGFRFSFSSTEATLYSSSFVMEGEEKTRKEGKNMREVGSDRRGGRRGKDEKGREERKYEGVVEREASL